MFLRILPENPNPIPPSMTSRRRSSEQPPPEPVPFRTQSAEHLFLTRAPTDPEQFVSELSQGIGAPGDSEPLGRETSNMSSGHLTSPISHQDFLSPSQGTEHSFADLSDYTSPDYSNALFLQPEFSFGDVINNAQNETEAQTPGSTAGTSHEPSTKRNTISTLSSGGQLLSPVPTNTPSPRSNDQASQHGGSTMDNGMAHSPLSMTDGRDSGRRISDHQRPTLSPPTHRVDNSEDQGHSDDPPPSPLVWVSRYSRGDSPSRESETAGRSNGKRSRSGHLSPVQDHESSDSEPESPTNTGSGHRKTFSVPVTASRNSQGSWLANPFTGQKGIDPVSRGEDEVISPKEMLERIQIEAKNAEVQQWLSCSEVEDNSRRGLRALVPRKFSVKPRRRTRSTGDSAGNRRPRPGYDFDDSRIPGPGALIEEESEEDEEEEDAEDNSSQRSDITPESPPAHVDVNRYPPVAPSDGTDSEEEDELPEQYVRPKLWKDPLRSTEFYGRPMQPESSSAAISRFQSRVRNLETASRTATCGMSDYDVESILGRDGIGGLEIGAKDKKKSRKNSLLSRASGLWPIRSNSNAKRKTTELVEQQSSAESLHHSKTNDTTGGNTSPSILSRRKPSFSRPTIPQINTSSAVVAMAGQIAAVGGGANATSPLSGTRPSDHRRRSRSKSDVSTSGSLMNLMQSHGGPPMPTLASPHPDRPTSSGFPNERAGNADEDDDMYGDDDDEVMDDKGFVMEFPVRTDLIVPTIEGFRTQVQQLNPRLQPALVERIAQEQVRRYRKLVDLKTKHAHSVHRGACTSTKFCFDLGGDATYLPPRASPKDPDSTYGQFQVQPPGAAEELGNGIGEGAVVAALFPPGVPLPPVKSLPAEFECSLCFKVKKFQKPSDWTKHVHEDLQPFTCTFPQCNEPKSFKRKADWVRHESERHRQLEWWKCNMSDCPHICYRKDNFVQHLVREHKMPDPKAKASKSRPPKNSKADNQDASHDPAMDELWRRVDECHHITDKQPRDEACRFCGNVCNSWKKLTVHMAKHMEQIAMPVLELVRQVKVPGGTTISQIDTGNFDFSPHQQHQQPQQRNHHHRQDTSSSHLSPHTNSRARAVPKVPVYNTGGLLAEAFGVVSTPISSRHLRTQAAVNNPPASHAAPVSVASPNYPVPSSYSHSSAMLYSNGGDQSHFAGRANSATYPPPSNPMPRHQQGLREMVQVPPTTGMPFNLDINAAVQTAGFDNSHIHASPEANVMYTRYPQSAGYEAAAPSFVYQPNNMGYPNGQMANGNGYMQYGPGSQ